MLGWWIGISTQTPEQRDGAGDEARKAALLGHWEIGLGGLDWLTGLVAEGRAAQLLHHGYPSRFTARAGDVLPLLAAAGAPGAGPTAGAFLLELHPDRIAACPADRVLTIDAWDLS
ncbi:hypothetical protein ACWDRR_30765 [Kitasatospora sp. NPDC003701]